MDNKEKTFISAVVYLHNDIENASIFIKKLLETLESNFENSEMIIVNDVSDPNCVDKVRNICGNFESCSVSVLNLSYFHGLESAMMAGIDMSIGDFIFQFDRTVLDFDPALIIQTYKKALQGFDVVSASPDIKARFTSHLFYSVFDRFSESKLKMNSERFRVVSRRLLNRVSSANKTVPYRKALYATSGFKGCTIKYTPLSVQITGKSRYERSRRRKVATDSLLLFTQFGYKFAMSMAILMMIVSITMVIYSVTVYIAAEPIEGWTTTILFLSIAFFGLFSVLMIIIRYLQILIELVFKRKHYCFESIEKLKK